ncbi:MAG: hypothetical protein QJR00_06930 [Bacillota bacterium]|nr:hypothetical protein [Bacillota bacterium]
MWNASTKFEEDLQSGRVFHAYFLSGPEDEALRLLESWSRRLLCHHPVREEKGLVPCGRCLSCLAYLAEGHPDLYRPKEGAPLGVEEVREAIQFASYRPYLAPRRVLILGPLRLMGAEASNALLKTLEEPPPGAVFLLYSQNHLEVLPTILSRCRRVDLGGEGQVEKELVGQLASDIRALMAGDVTAVDLAQRWAKSYQEAPLVEALAFLARDVLAAETGGTPDFLPRETSDLASLWEKGRDPLRLLMDLRHQLAFHVQAENAFLRFLLSLEGSP